MGWAARVRTPGAPSALDRTSHRRSSLSPQTQAQAGTRRRSARCRDKTGVGSLLNGDQAWRVAATYCGPHDPIPGGPRKWRSQSPMTGRRSMIACSKSSGKNLRLPNRAHGAMVAAGYPTTWALVVPTPFAFATFAITQRACLPPAPCAEEGLVGACPNPRWMPIPQVGRSSFWAGIADGHHGRGSDPAAPQPERFADEREAEIAGRSWIRRDRAC
jgi:hypothetical protein